MSFNKFQLNVCVLFRNHLHFSPSRSQGSGADLLLSLPPNMLKGIDKVDILGCYEYQDEEKHWIKASRASCKQYDSPFRCRFCKVCCSKDNVTRLRNHLNPKNISGSRSETFAKLCCGPAVNRAVINHHRPPKWAFIRNSGTRNQEPGTRNQEPGTRNQEPGTRNQEPGTI